MGARDPQFALQWLPVTAAGAGGLHQTSVSQLKFTSLPILPLGKFPGSSSPAAKVCPHGETSDSLPSLGI